MARIYLTGFSCFGTIASNPTEELIQELIKHVQQQQQGTIHIFTSKRGFSLELHSD